MRVRKKIRDYYLVRSGTDFCRKSMKHVSLVWIARRKKPEGINNSKQKKLKTWPVSLVCWNIFFLYSFVFVLIHTLSITILLGKRMSVLYYVLYNSVTVWKNNAANDVFFSRSARSSFTSSTYCVLLTWLLCECVAMWPWCSVCVYV